MTDEKVRRLVLSREVINGGEAYDAEDRQGRADVRAALAAFSAPGPDLVNLDPDAPWAKVLTARQRVKDLSARRRLHRVQARRWEAEWLARGGGPMRQTWLELNHAQRVSARSKREARAAQEEYLAILREEKLKYLVDLEGQIASMERSIRELHELHVSWSDFADAVLSAFGFQPHTSKSLIRMDVTLYELEAEQIQALALELAEAILRQAEIEKRAAIDESNALQRERDVATEEVVSLLRERDAAIAERDALRDRVAAVLEAARVQRDREAELAELERDDETMTHEYAHALLEEMVLALTQALALRDASEAVARERREVVDAAKAWDGVHATTSGFHALEHLRDRLILLREAERAEAEARERLEALR